MSLTKEQMQTRYNYAKKNLKRIPLDVQKEKYDEIKAAADSAGESVNGYIKRAIDERMERDGFAPAAAVPQSEPQDEQQTTDRKDGLPDYLTPEAAAGIDCKRYLSGDMDYQFEVGSIIGMENLASFADYLRQQLDKQ